MADVRGAAAVLGVVALVAAALLVRPGEAAASGLSAPAPGAPWSSPATADASAVYWNPAMLPAVGGVRVQGALALNVLSAGYRRERRASYQHEDSLRFALPLAAEDLDGGKSGAADEVGALDWIPGGELFAAVGLGGGVSVGLGLYAPYAAVLSLPDDGAQRWAVQEASVVVPQVTPCVAWQVAPWLSVGAGLHVAVGSLNMKQVVDLAGTDILGDALASERVGQPNDFGAAADPALRELGVLSRGALVHDAWALGLSFSVGLAVLPHRDVSLGLSYHHRTPMTFAGRFALDMSHDFFTGDLAAQGLLYAPRVEGDAWVELDLPPSLKAALAWRVRPTVLLVLRGEVFFYGVVQRFRVTLRSPDLAQPAVGIPDTARIDLPRRWRDTVALQVAAAWEVSADWTLGGSVGYQSPASPDETVDMASVDGHGLTLGALVGWRLAEGLRLLAGAGARLLLPREVRASDFDRGNGTYELLLVTGTLGLEAAW